MAETAGAAVVFIGWAAVGCLAVIAVSVVVIAVNVKNLVVAYSN